jgi:hypothetical protein
MPKKIKKKHIVKLLRYMDAMMVTEDYNEYLDKPHHVKSEDTEAELYDEAMVFSMGLVMSFFKEMGIDLSKDIKRHKQLNYNKIIRQAKDINEFSNIMENEFGWADPHIEY